MRIGVCIFWLGSRGWSGQTLRHEFINYDDPEIKPVLAEAENNFGDALFRKGQMDEAILHFQKFLEYGLDRGDGDRAEGHYNLGNALLQKGQIGEAIAHYREAVEIDGRIMRRLRITSLAFSPFRRDGWMKQSFINVVLELRLDREKAHYNLGNALLQKEKVEEAIAQYEKALQTDPRSISALESNRPGFSDHLKHKFATAPKSNRIGAASRSTFGREKPDHFHNVG